MTYCSKNVVTLLVHKTVLHLRTDRPIKSDQEMGIKKEFCGIKCFVTETTQ